MKKEPLVPSEREENGGAETAKKNPLAFPYRVAATTGITFTVLALGYLLLFFWASGGGGARYPFGTFCGYTLTKFAFLFLFALSLGFLNRIFETKKPRPVLRLIHFFASFASFVLFVIVLASVVNTTTVDGSAVNLTDTLYAGSTLTPQKVLGGMTAYVVEYFVCVGAAALFRRIFKPKKTKKEQEAYKEQF